MQVLGLSILIMPDDKLTHNLASLGSLLCMKMCVYSVTKLLSEKKKAPNKQSWSLMAGNHRCNWLNISLVAEALVTVSQLVIPNTIVHSHCNEQSTAKY